MFLSTEIIGQQQADLATQLMQAPAASKHTLEAPLAYRHAYVYMPGLTVTLPNGTAVSLCRAALGYSFAAGTTDGPGQFDFRQGQQTGNRFWDIVRNFLSTPTAEDTACHFPKPILLNTGALNVPYPWQVSTVPIQLLRIGVVVIAAVPAEFTTMAGRRLRQKLLTVFADELGEGVVTDIVIAGLTNSYSGYVTTYEEYQVLPGVYNILIYIYKYIVTQCIWT